MQGLWFKPEVVNIVPKRKKN